MQTQAQTALIAARNSSAAGLEGLCKEKKKPSSPGIWWKRVTEDARRAQDLLAAHKRDAPAAAVSGR